MGAGETGASGSPAPKTVSRGRSHLPSGTPTAVADQPPQLEARRVDGGETNLAIVVLADRMDTGHGLEFAQVDGHNGGRGRCLRDGVHAASSSWGVGVCCAGNLQTTSPPRLAWILSLAWGNVCMGVELFIHRHGTTEPDYYSMTGATGWSDVWLPAANALQLDLVPLLGDGTFGRLPPEYLPEVIAQLGRLREWMRTQGHDLYVEHLDQILPALSRLNPTEDTVSFG